MICNILTNTSEAIPCDSYASSGNRNSSNRSSPPHARVWNTVTHMFGRMLFGLSHRFTNTRSLSSRTPQNSSRVSSSRKLTAPASAMHLPPSCQSATKRLWSTWLRPLTAFRTPMNCCSLWSWNLLGRTRCRTRRTRWEIQVGRKRSKAANRE